MMLKFNVWSGGLKSPQARASGNACQKSGFECHSSAISERKPSSNESRSLLSFARGGDSQEFGVLLESYRGYLRMLAESRLDQKLRGRIGGSDIVQETMLQAHRDFKQFRGSSEREFLCWLRKILVHTLARTVEAQVLTKKRDVRRDVPRRVHVGSANSTMQFDIGGGEGTPSWFAQKRERAAILADVMQELSDIHREVLTLRNIKGMPFAEVAETMGRSVAATKMLWMRAIKQLRKLYEHRDEG